jgi:hypothetical protein
MNFKRVACVAFVAIVVSSSSVMTFAQATRQIGAWSIYNLSQGNKNTVMLQTSAIPENGDARDGAEAATLNVLCKNNKVVAIALHTTSSVEKRAVSYIEEVPTVTIVPSIEGQPASSQKWAVSEKGHTLSPFSEVFQGKLNQQWMKRLDGTHRVAFQVGGSQEELGLQPAFNTERLGAALSSAGCTP